MFSPLAMIEVGLRGGAVALLAVFALLLLRDGRSSWSGLYGALFALSVASYIIITAPGLLYLPRLWLLPLRLVSIGSVAMFWLYARAALDDGFAPSWRDPAVWIVVTAVGLGCRPGSGTHTVCLAFHALQLVCVALAMLEALSGRSGDLVEERRRFRVVFVIAAALYSAGIVGLETVQGGPPGVGVQSVANAAGLLAITFVFTVAQLALSERTPLAITTPARAAPAEKPVAAPHPERLDEQEAALFDRLRRLMENDRIYREEGLSVAALATRLDIPEHRLRRLINQRLGHRNFAAFINGYRLADASAALADPGQAAVPIVTIALDAGFQSLGPFNRAFKAATGMTPSDYRRQHLGGRPDGTPALADSEIGEAG